MLRRCRRARRSPDQRHEPRVARGARIHRRRPSTLHALRFRFHAARPVQGLSRVLRGSRQPAGRRAFCAARGRPGASFRRPEAYRPPQSDALRRLRRLDASLWTAHGRAAIPMKPLTHAGILTAGPYRDLAIGENEAQAADALHRFMLRLRMCEEALAREYHPADEMRCPVHFCVGQEAVPAALSQLLRPSDYLYSHHRSHGYYLAKHAPMDALFAELYGKATGANAGLAGSQDISFPKNRFYSGAVLAGAAGIAAGSALAAKVNRTGEVVVSGFGEAATDEGIFWETVNYATVAQLPLVLVCENNKYSVFSPLLKRTAKDNISE